MSLLQCATGNSVPVPVPVDPVIFSDPVLRPNTDRIDRIWLSPGKNAFLNLGVGFDIM